MMRKSRDERRAALYARTPTPVLVKSMVALDALPTPSQAERLALAWTRDEIERRIPEVGEALEKAFYAAALEEERTGETVEVSYTAVVLAAIAGLNAEGLSESTETVEPRPITGGALAVRKIS